MRLGYPLAFLAAAIGLARAGQPPAPIPSSVSSPSAVQHPEPALAQFEPLVAFPQATRAAVRSVVSGSNWLARMNQSQGRFLYGYRPALRQPMKGDGDLPQAQAALALAQSARFTGSERQAAIASQAVLTLLSATKVDPADPKCRFPAASSMYCNRVGFAATLALAIYAIPGADDKLIAEAERLCEFLRKQAKVDGSIHYIDSPSESATQIDPAGANEYPGIALQAIAASNRLRPADWKADLVKKGIAHYRAWFKANPHPLLAATLAPGFAEYSIQMKSSEAAAAVFELNDWLAAMQYPAGDARHPLWAGGFKSAAKGQLVESEPGCECGIYLKSLAWAYQAAGLDADRQTRYKQALLEGVQFLSGLQYDERNTRHFENSFRANMLIGGFYFSPTNGNLRIDSTAQAVSGMLQFLACGAQKN